ncbi:SDR family NAD(P)-dependent oxidoreductase [Pseudoalteromonas sp. CO325X]|uniref:SDR family NAD(P)-dependent oxidoreductase n=1 Tax=Pseudoalteromonas sp. CO325X TaxID=1777262 RepID=UPI001022E840|nr:SDR family NAD(P)-dependent oxidoreductase [Pseudoalteromonas sp. CO325X]RZF81451.1 SDR family NAD(P)-dependent oxidoreductase [Pseudoalteromonas sp. CO325X]
MSQSQVMKQALIIGASSAIAKALIEELEQQQVEVTSVSRSQLERSPHSLVDYDDEAINEWVKELNGQRFDYIYICNGVLHGQGVAPEKSLSAFNEQQFNEVIRANTLVPMLWLKHTPVLVPRNEPSVVTIFSARVGSISDNRLGGWYSYRASKAALNMLVKTASVEVRRTHKQAKFVLFHPGTTDTPLSKPFQKNVPEHKLFTPAFVAQRLRELTLETQDLPECGYFDWDKSAIQF